MPLTENVTGLIKGEHWLLYEFGSADSGCPHIQKRFCTVQHNFPLLHVTPAAKVSQGRSPHTHTHTRMASMLHITFIAPKIPATHSGNWPSVLPFGINLQAPPQLRNDIGAALSRAQAWGNTFHPW